jgi:hypothetical protein
LLLLRPAFAADGDIALCMTRLDLSAQAYHRTLKPARTIVDLARSEEIQSVYLADALHLRQTEVAGGVRYVKSNKTLQSKAMLDKTLFILDNIQKMCIIQYKNEDQFITSF